MKFGRIHTKFRMVIASWELEIRIRLGREGKGNVKFFGNSFLLIENKGQWAKKKKKKKKLKRPILMGSCKDVSYILYFKLNYSIF